MEGCVGVDEDAAAGGGGSGGEGLLLDGAVGPAGSDGVDVVKIVGPMPFVGVFDYDVAWTDSGDIVVPIDDGAGGEGADLNVVVAVGDFSYNGLGLGCGAGAQGGCEQ